MTNERADGTEAPWPCDSYTPATPGVATSCVCGWARYRHREEEAALAQEQDQLQDEYDQSIIEAEGAWLRAAESPRGDD